MTNVNTSRNEIHHNCGTQQTLLTVDGTTTLHEVWGVLTIDSDDFVVLCLDAEGDEFVIQRGIGLKEAVRQSRAHGLGETWLETRCCSYPTRELHEDPMHD